LHASKAGDLLLFLRFSGSDWTVEAHPVFRGHTELFHFADLLIAPLEEILLNIFVDRRQNVEAFIPFQQGGEVREHRHLETLRIASAQHDLPQLLHGRDGIALRSQHTFRFIETTFVHGDILLSLDK